jgi:hypothetical protein
MSTRFRVADYSRSEFAVKRFPKLTAKLGKKVRGADFMLLQQKKVVGYAEIEAKLAWKKVA